MSQKPTLVFAHANGVPGGSYQKFLGHFANQYQLAVMPQLAHNPDYPVDLYWRSLADELEAFIKPLPKPVLGMGHSMGGVLMFVVAARNPDWFKGLVMLDPPLVNGWMVPVFALMRKLGLIDRFTPAGKSKYRRDFWPSREAAEANFKSKPFFQRFDPESLQHYMDAVLQQRDDGVHLGFTVANEVAIFRNGPPPLGRMRLRVPGLLVNGLQSETMFRIAGARHVKKHRMDYSLIDGSHMYPLEHPQATAHQVQQWLAKEGLWQQPQAEQGDTA